MLPVGVVLSVGLAVLLKTTKIQVCPLLLLLQPPLL
jgi:hypothetical protein